MIDLLLALHGLAKQRGEGLLPEWEEGLRKIQRLGDGRLIAIDGDAGDYKRDKNIVQAPASTGQSAAKPQT
jgi:hypothetical protein